MYQVLGECSAGYAMLGSCKTPRICHCGVMMLARHNAERMPAVMRFRVTDPSDRVTTMLVHNRDQLIGS